MQTEPVKLEPEGLLNADGVAMPAEKETCSRELTAFRCFLSFKRAELHKVAVSNQPQERGEHLNEPK